MRNSPSESKPYLKPTHIYVSSAVLEFARDVPTKNNISCHGLPFASRYRVPFF